ncbi:unnamed protein product, partial [Onchocerca ochengi]|uniref:RPN2_C domain-containing protein n=1 Tax=Onchocerca ochengi TaxID=42157 RepID=A0A182EFX6_ONCOC
MLHFLAVAKNPTVTDSGTMPVVIVADSKTVVDSDVTEDAAADTENTPAPVKAGSDGKLPEATIA